MGFSNNMGNASAEAQPTPQGSGLEDRLAGYFKSQFPVAGGLAQAIFGSGSASQTAPPVQPQMSNQAPPLDSELLGMNAMPKQGGGGSLLLKLFGL